MRLFSQCTVKSPEGGTRHLTGLRRSVGLGLRVMSTIPRDAVAEPSALRSHPLQLKPYCGDLFSGKLSDNQLYITQRDSIADYRLVVKLFLNKFSYG